MDKIKSFFIKYVKDFLWIILLINLWFWQGRLKAMWIYGEAIMVEPNKIIAFSEWIMAVVLTIWIALICFRKYYENIFNLFAKDEKTERSKE